MYAKFSRCRIVVFLALAPFIVSVTDDQVIAFDNVAYSAGVMPVQDATSDVYDYFDAAKIRIVGQRLQAVEQHHMNKEVLENIANGKYKYALADINFTLRYFPN